MPEKLFYTKQEAKGHRASSIGALESASKRQLGTSPERKRDRLRSPLRHLNAAEVGAKARTESRNREVYLPPVSVYRWWARRTEAVNGAIVDAYSEDHPGRLLVADPFAGGGVIPLAAVLRGHRVYAQDLNPWAAEGLCGVLGMPGAAKIREATHALQKLIGPSLGEAYATVFSDGEPAEIAHTFRVATAECSHCGVRGRLFPHALVSLKARRERKKPGAFLACPAGHLFEGEEKRKEACPTCDRVTDPSGNYTGRRSVVCWSCGKEDRLETRAKTGDWRWEVVLVERSKGRERELAVPTRDEIAHAEGSAGRQVWEPNLELARIPDGQETRVLTRHGFVHWHDLYPLRQRVLIERLLACAAETSNGDEQILHVLRLAVIGSAEMAGHLSRWDRFYLKSYESMAAHRFNFSTLVAEPNVWGASASGRGTVRRRLERFAKIAEWMQERVGRTLEVEGPIAGTAHHSSVPAGIDVRVVEGSSERMLLPDKSVDLVLTDPPYHDDVQYDELSLPLRAWAELSLEHLKASASVNRALEHNSNENEYEALLTNIFAEIRRTLRADGHLVFSYANRVPEAWSALFSALDRAGFRACGYLVVHSENESDVSKRGVRACTLDLIMDLVPNFGHQTLEQWQAPSLPATDEGRFLGIVGENFLMVGSPSRWRAGGLVERLRETAFYDNSKKVDGIPIPKGMRPLQPA